ncbi:MAG: ABC transporter permease [Ignavibacteriae bacterium]|nr:ABC transporter permease [Ignavibacteriota bacterium]
MDFREIIAIALAAIRANKLRSALTLLGIVVGVFSIIGVMTAVGVLQNSIESGLSVLGAHTFQIEKFPRMVNLSRKEWARIRNRKNISYEQASLVEEKMTQAEYIGIEAYEQGKIVVGSDGEKTNPVVTFYGETPDGFPTNNWTIQDGRSITNDDVHHARPVIVLGANVVERLFPRGGAVGSVVKVDGHRYTVIGTTESRGSSMGGNQDYFTVIPLTLLMSQYGKERTLNIMIRAKSAEVYDDAVEEARFILRAARKVDPGEQDDFSIFSNDSLIDNFNSFTYYVKLGIGFISFISLLAAGVGIMNIMLVSVTERTKEIGIRKAIGARRRAILMQFIAEAIVLCQIGGLVGIALGILGGNLIALMFEVPAIFPVDWALIGFALCAFIGVAFGVYPAWKAANLDPIEALRYE